MFACVVEGSLVNTSFTLIDLYKYTIDIPLTFSAKDKTTQICLFLTGQSPLPDGAAAAIHYSWSPDFSFNRISFLSNQRPSSIFKVSVPISGSLTLRIGISIENDISVVNQQLKQVASEGHEIARIVAENFHNYITSFPQVQTQGVPLALLDKWFSNFENKLKNNPSFLNTK